MTFAAQKGANPMRRAAFFLVLAGLFVGTSGVAFADAPPAVQPHQHFLVLPDGTQLPVGPDICANPADSQGFYGFHQNVHFGTPNQFAFDQGGNPVDFTAVFGCP
jgi:hypothetical protein